MKIHVRTLKNHIYDISVNSNDKVKTIKDKIQETEGIPPDQQSLIFSGNLLKDEYFISDYNITENSTIHLVLKLRGGRCMAIKDNQIEEEKGRKEEEGRKKFFKFRFEDKDYFFSYGENLTIKEMLTDCLSKIDSKENPENCHFIYHSYILNQHFSKKIKEIFRKKEDLYTIKILGINCIPGGNK